MDLNLMWKQFSVSGCSTVCLNHQARLQTNITLLNTHVIRRPSNEVPYREMHFSNSPQCVALSSHTSPQYVYLASIPVKFRNVFCSKAHLINCNWYRISKPSFPMGITMAAPTIITRDPVAGYTSPHQASNHPRTVPSPHTCQPRCLRHD